MGWTGRGESSKQEAELAVVSLRGARIDGKGAGARAGQGELVRLSAEGWPGAACSAAPGAPSPGP